MKRITSLTDSSPSHRYLTRGLLLSAVIALLTSSPSAHAEIRLNVGGSIRLDGGTHRVHRPRRPRHSLRINLGGFFSFGRWRIQAPPVVVHTRPRRPLVIHSPPPPPIVVPPQQRYDLPPPAALPNISMHRFAIGVFAGSNESEFEESGSESGLIGRFRLSSHFELEAEVAKTNIDDRDQVTRRLGGAMLYHFSPERRFSIYGLVGGGYGKTHVGDGSLFANHGYGEIGVGLTWKATERFHLITDLRAGNKRIEEKLGKATLNVPQSYVDEEFSRLRFGALLYF